MILFLLGEIAGALSMLAGYYLSRKAYLKFIICLAIAMLTGFIGEDIYEQSRYF